MYTIVYDPSTAVFEPASSDARASPLPSPFPVPTGNDGLTNVSAPDLALIPHCPRPANAVPPHAAIQRRIARQEAEFLDAVAPHHGDAFWTLSSAER